jgi:polysaccharide export outer membrane protein
MSLVRSVYGRGPIALLSLLLMLPVLGRSQQESQQPQGPPPSQQVQPPTAVDPNVPAAAPAPVDAPAASAGRIQMSSPASSTPTEMLIGPGDEGEIRVFGVPELGTHFRVESTGDVYLPLIGKVHLAGLNADAAQIEVSKKYEEGGFLHNPHITIYVKEYTTQGISVLGEVTRPGIYSALNARRLYDVFLIAGGLTARAGKTATITHSKEPDKPVVVKLESGAAANQANIEILPGDTITVSRAGVVYVIGEVNRPGAFVMETTTTASLLQMLALAAGPTRAASLAHTRVIRRVAKGGLESKDIDLKKIMQAKASDVEVQAEDIVFVPSSRGKAAMERGGSSILSMLTSLAVYRF